jgi:hypothetical protein
VHPTHLLGSEAYLQFPGGNPGVLVKGLIEVPQVKEDNRLGILPLNPEVLLTDRVEPSLILSLFYEDLG